MQLAIRALQRYVPKARPYARMFLTLISSFMEHPYIRAENHIKPEF